MSSTHSSSHSTLPRFAYSPLRSPHTLRLVKLNVGSRNSDDIDIELVEALHSRPEPGLPQDLDLPEVPQQHRRANQQQPRHHVINSINHYEPYEAVSWCWGTERWNKSIRIHGGEKVYSFLISPNLHSALKAFRREDRVRTLWVDAISINQQDTNEKNHQVPMMSKVYGSATSVLIWLGDGDDKSKMALDFIKNDVLKLWEFDELCDDTSTAPKWDALIALMKRPWFSRRWVVQEIVLANQAMLQVGQVENTWQQFADAVSLFVEVETATHRLSEVMKKDPTFYHIPDFFGV